MDDGWNKKDAYYSLHNDLLVLRIFIGCQFDYLVYFEMVHNFCNISYINLVKLIT
jgi:hypothetical protein